MLTLISIPAGGFTTTITTDLPGGLFITIFLIILLSLKEIISASKFYDKRTEYNLNISIYPLLFVFFAIVVSKTIEVLYP